MKSYLRLSLLLGAVCSFSPLLAAPLADDFAAYEEASSGAPHWEALDVGFEVRQGAMEAELRERRSFAVWQSAPIGSVGTVEGSVMPRQALGKGWRTAGIGFFVDWNNHWHLALVETPDGQRRYFELSEMLDGKWNAQVEEGSRLTTLEERGGESWEYGRSYRLKIALSKEGEQRRITGEVFEGERLLYRCVRLLDAPAVDRGRPMITAGVAAVRFDDLRADITETAAATPEAKRFTRPPFQSSPLVRSGAANAPATGFFRVQREGETWWLVDPAGKPTLSVGTDHVRYDGHWCEALGYAPYGRVAARKYGSAEKWAAEATRRLRAWNFNMLGAGSTAQARYQGLAHTEFLSFGADFCGVAALVEKTTWTGWPDVFDRRFERFCDIQARARCAPHRDDPWLLGYFIDNELEWWGKSHRPWGMAEDTWKLSPQAAGKQALWATLRRAFQDDVKAFSEAFGTQIESWEALLQRAELPQPKTERARAALEAFISEAAARYFRITTAAIRRHDPNHLILGCRFAHNAPDGAWRAAGETCDIVTVNVYPRIDLRQQRVLENEEHLRSRFALCGKPLIVTEWSFPALDAKDSTGRPLPSKNGAGMRVDNQEQKAQCYAIMQRSLFSLPFVVGSHYFMYLDEPALGVSSSFPEDSNYGLVSESDEPYGALTATAGRVNAQMLALHAGELKVADIAPAEIRDTPASAPPLEPGELKITRDGDAFTITNGPLRLEHAAGKSAAFSSIWRRDEQGAWVELGSYEAVLSLSRDGANFWPRAERVVALEVREQTPERLVWEMEFAHDSALPWRGAYRFTMKRGEPWFRAQALWIENSSAAAWKLRGYFHYLPSRLSGDTADDEPGGPGVPSYYLPIAAWREKSSPWQFGAATSQNDRHIEFRFWKDEAGQHPDAWRKLDMELSAGARWQAQADEPIASIFGLRATPENPRPWMSLAEAR